MFKHNISVRFYRSYAYRTDVQARYKITGNVAFQLLLTRATLIYNII